MNAGHVLALGGTFVLGALAVLFALGWWTFRARWWLLLAVAFVLLTVAIGSLLMGYVPVQLTAPTRPLAVLLISAALVVITAALFDYVAAGRLLSRWMLALAAGADGAPVPPAALVADIGGGSYPAVVNILLALRERDRRPD